MLKLTEAEEALDKAQEAILHTALVSINKFRVISDTDLSGASTTDTVGVLALSLLGRGRGSHVYSKSVRYDKTNCGDNFKSHTHSFEWQPGAEWK